MKAYTLENQTYHWSGSCWLDDDFVAVSGSLAERLCSVHQPTVTGILRDQGLPEKGLTISHGGPFCSALLLARAGCWCDLRRYKQARTAARMALEMGAGVKALNVLARIERAEEGSTAPSRRR